MAEKYANEVIEMYVIPKASAIGPDFIFMDDSAYAHRAIKYLETTGVIRMSDSCFIPDLNSFKHVWDMLQRAISTRPV